MHEIYYSGLVQLSQDTFSNIEAFIKKGATHVEIFMDGPQWSNLSYSNKEIAEKLLQYPLTYSVHGPMFDLNLASFHSETRTITIKKLLESIEFAKQINAQHVIISPAHLAVSTFERQSAIQFLKEGLEPLVAYAKRKNLSLLIENSGTGGKELFDAEEFIKFAAYLHKKYEKTAGIVLDTGHAHLNNWDIPDVIKRLGSTLQAVHLNDNNGSIDNHLAMGDGSIQWKPIFLALKNTSVLPRLILEYNTVMPFQRLKEGKDWLEKEGF